MKRIEFIQHKGKPILTLNFSGCSPAEVLKVIEEARPIFASQPHNSVLALDVVNDAHFDIEVVEALKNFTVHNKPYVKGVAVVGVTGLQKLLLQSIQTFSKRNIYLFDGVEQAKDWLVGLS